jgi:hypothetical protein
MRWLMLCGMALGIVVSTHPAPAFAAGPADGPGCLGVMAEECVRWLRATMTVDENFLVAAMAHRHEADVNGKPLGGGFVSVHARLPGELDNFVILLHLRPDDTVQSVESNVLDDLLDAGTERLYDRTKVYDIVWRLVGRRCPGISRIELYRFFENSVKPRVTRQRQDFSGGINGLHRIWSRAAAVPYCGGISFSYTHVLEWRAAKNPEAAAKTTDFSSIELR